MTKKEYIKSMKVIIALNKIEDKLNKVLKELSPSFNYLSFGRHEDLIVSLIEKAVGDKYDWTSYWLYDLDCGEKAEEDTVKDKDGKPIPIKTLGNLYDLIKNDYNKFI